MDDALPKQSPEKCAYVGQKTTSTVYLLWHTRELPAGGEDSKLIGVYASAASAAEAQKRASALPGFRDQPEGFEIGEYAIGKDHWTEGFATATAQLGGPPNA